MVPQPHAASEEVPLVQEVEVEAFQHLQEDLVYLLSSVIPS
jgi:hypothetical protein